MNQAIDVEKIERTLTEFRNSWLSRKSSYGRKDRYETTFCFAGGRDGGRDTMEKLRMINCDLHIADDSERMDLAKAFFDIYRSRDEQTIKRVFGNVELFKEGLVGAVANYERDTFVDRYGTFGRDCAVFDVWMEAPTFRGWGTPVFTRTGSKVLHLDGKRECVHRIADLLMPTQYDWMLARKIGITSDLLNSAGSNHVHLRYIIGDGI